MKLTNVLATLLLHAEQQNLLPTMEALLAD